MLTKILCSIIGFKAVIKDEDSMKDLYFHVTYVDRLIIELAGTLREIVFDWGAFPSPYNATEVPTSRASAP